MKHFVVKAEDVGERLDKFLVKKLEGVSRQAVKELLDGGRVKVSGKRVVIAKWEMLLGDEVEVRASDEEFQRREFREVAAPEARGFIEVVYEDRDVIVVLKPAGALVQASRESGGPTYVDSLRAYLKRKHKSGGAYVKPVHRLDKETSGLMVFAKSRKGEELLEQFKRHTVQRSYLAVVEGVVKGENGRIDLPIAKGEFGHGRRAHTTREGAMALTLYSVKERYKDATFLQLDLKTGRTHQARVHMAAIGHPIVGDRVYGVGGRVRFGRHALHSSRLAFNHPATGKQMKFSADLPDDMKRLVDVLREGGG